MSAPLSNMVERVLYLIASCFPAQLTAQRVHCLVVRGAGSEPSADNRICFILVRLLPQYRQLFLDASRGGGALLPIPPS